MVRKLELQDAAALQDLEKRKKLLISNASVHEERIDTEENDRLRTVREREHSGQRAGTTSECSGSSKRST